MSLSKSLEDYLEVIAQLSLAHGSAHSKDIAAALNVTTPSVTTALRILSEKGYINYQSYMPIELTEKGSAAAEEIILRHEKLKHFFDAVLKLPAPTADDLACKLEHILPDEVVNRIVALSRTVEELPADAQEKLEHAFTEIPIHAESLIPLAQITPEHAAEIARILPNLEGMKKWASLGLTVGAPVMLLSSGPFGDPLRIRLRGTVFTMRKKDAQCILTRPASPREG